MTKGKRKAKGRGGSPATGGRYKRDELAPEWGTRRPDGSIDREAVERANAERRAMRGTPTAEERRRVAAELTELQRAEREAQKAPKAPKASKRRPPRGKVTDARAAAIYVAERLGLPIEIYGVGPLTDAERATLHAALDGLRVDLVTGSLRDQLTTIAWCAGHERPTGDEGRPSPRMLARALKRAAAIVESRERTRAPKVLALLVWLWGAADAIAAPRGGETGTNYLARLTRAIEKRIA